MNNENIHTTNVTKDCNSCKCLTCKNGMLFPGTCKVGTNCAICQTDSNLPNHKDTCPKYESGY